MISDTLLQPYKTENSLYKTYYIMNAERKHVCELWDAINLGKMEKKPFLGKRKAGM